ncbi:adenylate/guanylate cyclase domain-containing protein [Desulfobacula sp.]|uniref:adenylate/guanylate cyclase domain-containing protein n=1 Tax=Desulfobacula sp. TaxID=2593537 RepID=UPI00261A31CD|nr:adenylate/guanylate cyclase domain-containing protein [Desulfobacula sp.]
MTTEQNVTRKLAAILSADVKGYSLLMRDDELATVQTLKIYRELMATLIHQHHGRVVDSPGDNVLAEFASVVDAVQGAVSIQKELKVKNDTLRDKRKMEFRIGINLGDVIVENDHIYGDGVNIAARLEGMADPGGICISRTAFDQIEDKLPFGYEYLGEKFAKNITKPVRAYKVNIWPETHTSKVLKTGMTKASRKIKKVSSLFKMQEQDPQAKKQMKRLKSKQRFMFHLKAYLGVIGFLFIINILTYHGSIWFYWPALGWGLFLYLHWLRKSYTNRSGR